MTEAAEKPCPVPAPPWVAWVAQDANGNWWGYSAEPHRNDYGWYENEVGDYVCLGRSESPGWENSLTRHCAD